MTDKPPASIVIPTLHAPAYLDVTLTSLMPQARAVGAEVIVVRDGGPDPATDAVATRHGATLVGFDGQRGLNSGRNAGIAKATSDLLVFIDQDIEAPPGWLEAILEGVRATSEREVFGGPIRGRLEGGRPGCGREPAPITTLDAGPEDRDVPLVWGANMAMRRSAFDRVGRFDEALRGRGDEEEWEFRWVQSGGQIRYLARAGLDHRRAPDDSRISVLARAAYGQGREARRHDVREGKARSIRTELGILFGCAWHTIRRRCVYGVVMGARAAGSLHEALAGRRS